MIFGESIVQLAIFCRRWKREYELRVSKDLEDAINCRDVTVKKYDEMEVQAKAALCRTADIVGIASLSVDDAINTNAENDRQLLQALGAKIGKFIEEIFQQNFYFILLQTLSLVYTVIVVDAAKIPEAHVVYAITPACQQLIMIGKLLLYL